MNDPRQYLLHLTSRGSGVITYKDCAVGKFINYTKQPIKGINKFGLLQYSIPKMLDCVNDANRQFTLKFTYNNGVSVSLPVRLPLLDYYNAVIEYNGARSFANTLVSLQEILQTSINWAIQKDWENYKVANNSVSVIAGSGGQRAYSRLGCIVQLTDDKRFRFLFGYRGARAIDASGDYTGPVYANSGCPFLTELDNDPPEVFQANLNTRYNWVLPGFGNAQDSTDQFVSQLTWHAAANNPTLGEQALECGLARVEFLNISKRLQLLMGMPSANLASATYFTEVLLDDNTGAPAAPSPVLYVDQTHDDGTVLGRMLLASYRVGTGGNSGPNYPGVGGGRTGILTLESVCKPNLYAPSFLFLTLTAQGTRTKVLGHNAETGGWAIPTPPTLFQSKYNNFPSVLARRQQFTNYGIGQVRSTPFIFNHQKEDQVDCADGTGAFVSTGNFYYVGVDPPANEHAAQVFASQSQTSWHPAGQIWYERDNYALNGNNAAGVSAGHSHGSQFIYYGDKVTQIAQIQNLPRAQKVYGASTDGGVDSPVFNVAMIEPNWIYTTVEDSTLQSLDVSMSWGDTGDHVEDTSALPVQFSIIASP